MKLSRQNKQKFFLYLEPYTFSVTAGNDVLIYNSLNRKILEYRDSPSIAEIIGKAEDPGKGFLAEINIASSGNDLTAFVNDLRDSFSGDIITIMPGKKPAVVRPKPVIKSYPPAKNFPSFSADDYLRNLYFFLNQDNDRLCKDYRFAMNQFFCPVYDADGYHEMKVETVTNNCSLYSGITGLGLDLSGSDITKYSGMEELLPGLRKLSLPVTFHIPLPCNDPESIWRFLKIPASRVSLYITFPDGLPAVREIRSHTEFSKRSNRIQLNFLIRSMEEYQAISEISGQVSREKIFILPYYNGENSAFFKENVFLVKQDILGLKPNQQQIYSRSLINEQLYGRLFIKTGGEAFANLNHDSIGNISETSISELVKNELYNGKSWNLTRMKVKPCGDCLYRLFCPPVGNYEIFMNRYNFCDVL
jgi:pseudo-rSAM protein